MRNYRLVLMAVCAAALSGCAAFTSGDVKVDKAKAERMFSDRSPAPFSSISLEWKNIPYKTPSDSIGQESVIDGKGNIRPPQRQPAPVDPEDTEKLLSRASNIFTRAGLLNPAGGGGKLKLTMISMHRWNYSELFGSFLVDTGFIFILPSHLRTNYLLSAEFAVSTGTARVEVLGRNKTTFHLLLAPLYPFLAPGGQERGLLKQMLWRLTTEVHDKLQNSGLPAPASPAGRSGADPAPVAPAPPQAATEAVSAPAPAAPQANSGLPETKEPPAPGEETPDD